MGGSEAAIVRGVCREMGGGGIGNVLIDGAGTVEFLPIALVLALTGDRFVEMEIAGGGIGSEQGRRIEGGTFVDKEIDGGGGGVCGKELADVDSGDVIAGDPVFIVDAGGGCTRTCDMEFEVGTVFGIA